MSLSPDTTKVKLAEEGKKSILLFRTVCQTRETGLNFKAIGKLATVCSYTADRFLPPPLFATLLISLQQVTEVVLVASCLTGLEYLMTVWRSLRQMVLDIFHGISYKPRKKLFESLFLLLSEATVVGR